MDLIAGTAPGLAMLWSPLVLTACALGLLAGVIAGFLPGLSPAGGLALAAVMSASLIESFPVQSPVVFMMAFACGTFYGRALAAINFDVATAKDATPIDRSDWPPLIATLLISVAAAAAAPLLAAAGRSTFSASFGPAEASALVVFTLLGGAAFARGSAASALAVVVLGLLLRLVGADIETGTPRLTFGLPALEDGFGLIEVALGLFVIGNVIDDFVRAASGREGNIVAPDSAVRGLWPGAILAWLAGFLPTNGATFATTAAAARQRLKPDLFDPASQRGTAAILRAAMLSDIRLSASLIVLFLWLTPIDAMTVLLRGPVYGQAMLTNAVTDPTPIAWLAGATLVIAHIVPLIIIAILTQAPWRPITVPVRSVAASLVIAACIATWLVHDSDPSAVAIMLMFGLIGYAMIRGGLDRSLMFFAFAVGAMFEENVRRTLLIARGDPTVYLERPVCAALLIAGALLFVIARAWRPREA
jgi:putative tricarboxylic transport membrane protein